MTTTCIDSGPRQAGGAVRRRAALHRRGVGGAAGRDAGADLPGAAAALVARTEGWAAELQLAALTLQRQADPAGLVAAFSGSDRYVLDYLTDQVLAGQSEPMREFLLDTSVLDRLLGELCGRGHRPGR